LKKGYPDSIVEFVVQELTDEGIINDGAIAAAILKSCKDQKAESSSSALKRMIRLGIDDNIAKSGSRKNSRIVIVNFPIRLCCFA